MSPPFTLIKWSIEIINKLYCPCNQPYSSQSQAIDPQVWAICFPEPGQMGYSRSSCKTGSWGLEREEKNRGGYTGRIRRTRRCCRCKETAVCMGQIN